MMKKHVEIYLDYFGHEDYIYCEVCSKRAVDIHHIKARGMGGSKSRDEIGNLMALCRECHEKYGDKKQYVEFLKQKHEARIKTHPRY